MSVTERKFSSRLETQKFSHSTHYAIEFISAYDIYAVLNKLYQCLCFDKVSLKK